MSEITLAELVDKVAERTAGSARDYLTRRDVAQIVEATLLELEAAGASDELDVVDDAGGSSIGAMSETPETEPNPDEPTPTPAPPEPGDPGEPGKPAPPTETPAGQPE